MRYSIIHHDVRERFGLSPYEYMVIDSIHQLSHQKATHKKNTEIASFIGLSEAMIRKVKEIGKEKGLLSEDEDGGWISTELWVNAVTWKSHDMQKSHSMRENRTVCESDYIYKEVNNNPVSKETVSYEVVSDKPKREKKPQVIDEAMKLREKLYKVVEREKGVAPTPHKGDYFAVLKALKRLTAKQIEELVGEGMESPRIVTVRQALAPHYVDKYLQDNY